MKSRVEPRIRELFLSGGQYSKAQLAELVNCDKKTAWRVITKMEKEGVIVPVKWERTNGGPMPIMAAKGKPAEKPKPLSANEKARRRRAKRGNREVENAAKRLKRLLENPPRLGFWNI